MCGFIALLIEFFYKCPSKKLDEEMEKKDDEEII